jgi:hypothetical protein
MRRTGLGYMTWQGTYMNGWRTGMERVITAAPQPITQPDLPVDNTMLCEAAGGLTFRSTCELPVSTGSLRTVRAPSSASVAPALRDFLSANGSKEMFIICRHTLISLYRLYAELVSRFKPEIPILPCQYHASTAAPKIILVGDGFYNG